MIVHVNVNKKRKNFPGSNPVQNPSGMKNSSTLTRLFSYTGFLVTKQERGVSSHTYCIQIEIYPNWIFYVGAIDRT